ncbi:hypothetical protein D3C75_730000 [compost metagenome]
MWVRSLSFLLYSLFLQLMVSISEQFSTLVQNSVQVMFMQVSNFLNEIRVWNSG